MSFFERRVSVTLFVIALLLVCFKSYKWYIFSTTLVPADGGQYTEAVVGDVQYLNPILVQTDAEKSLSHLIFSGLVKLDSDKVSPDLAESWEVLDEGQSITFHLRKDVVFHDGTPLTTNDIAYTIDSIKAPELKSPLAKMWADVSVNVVDDYTITFRLSKPYGPLIYNCDFGIIPSRVSSDIFAKKLIGTGIYQFAKAKTKGKTIVEVDLKRNQNYYGKQALIEKVKTKYFSDAKEAQKAFTGDKMSALSGTVSEDGKNYSFPTSKKLGLVLNIRTDKLKDIAVRQKILDGQKFESPIALTLTAPDTALQKSKAEQIKTTMKDKNVELTLNLLNPVKLQEALSAKSYELLLYGFDFGYDRDPYVSWHSSQLNAMNLAGWGDKQTDILLEDARMIVDLTARNKKYDEFFDKIKGQYLVYYYDPIDFNYIVRTEIKNFTPITGNQASSRYNTIDSWFMKEKRVKK